MEKRLNFIELLRKSAILFVLLLVILVFSIMAPNFRTLSNLVVILRQVSILSIVSVGMALVLISGGIDLSVGAQIAMVGVVTSLSAVNWGISPVLSLIIGLALGALIGFVNGVIITSTRMPAMIATLAMMTLIRGAGFIICQGNSIYKIPEWYKVFAQGYVGPIPVPVIIMFAVLLIGAFLLNFTYIGRYFYAVGSNEEATRLSGLNINKIRILAYTICGFLTAIAGIVMMSRVNSGQPKVGDGYEMDVLTACVVGGVSITGGEGKIFRVFLGVLIIGVLSNGLTIIGVDEYWQQVAKGLVLMLAVGFDSVQKLQKGNKGKKAAPKQA